MRIELVNPFGIYTSFPLFLCAFVSLSQGFIHISQLIYLTDAAFLNLILLIYY